MTLPDPQFTFDQTKPEVPIAETRATVDQARALRSSGDPKGAVKLLRRAVEAEPKCSALREELGDTLCSLGRQEEAIGAYQVAFQLNPDRDELCRKVGSAFSRRGLMEPALVWFQMAQRKNPDISKYRHELGSTLIALGMNRQAAELYDRWVQEEPDNPVARHLADAARGAESPTTTSTGYVQALFNRFASYYDERLSHLKYCGPQLVCEALQRFSPTMSPPWNVLDAGCGTGLVGAPIRHLAGRLIGVDLSAEMLNVARARNVYDELIEAEIIDYLSHEKRTHDVVIAADVLTYSGKLDEFFAAAKKVLSPGGVVAVTVEALQGDAPYRLNPTGRYCHNPRYLRRAMEGAGLVVLCLDTAVMRYEVNRPVQSLVAIAVRPI